VIVDSVGLALLDTHPPIPGRRFFASRPEFAAALKGNIASGTRHSNTLRADLIYVAVPVASGGRVRGAVRITYPTSTLDARVRRYWLLLAAIGGVVLAAATVVGLRFARTLTEPLSALEQTAAAVGGGDLRARAPANSGPPEVRALAAEFNETVARLDTLLRSQKEFVADASHQLRTPLTGLRLRIEEARAAGVNPAAARELDAGAGELDRLAQILEELLVLSRAGEREQPGERVELAATVQRAADRWRAAAAAREIELELRSGAGGAGGATWCAPADADRALDVLLENAVHYAPRGSRITLASAPGEITVRDCGPGLAADEQEAIFERFHRGSAGVAGPPGSGLGLAIARELAREWGGEVTLANAEGGGALATLKLPVHER
jgi:signal transduction histidine kinase